MKSDAIRYGYKLMRQRKDGRLGPLFSSSACAARIVALSWLPASVTPTVSRMPTLAQWTAAAGRSCQRSAALREASSMAKLVLVILV